MSEKDIQNLIELAKQKLNEKVSREQALASFVAAGILDKKGGVHETLRTPQAS